MKKLLDTFWDFKYDIFTTDAIKWQTDYSYDERMGEILYVKKYNWKLDYETTNEYITLKESPKRKFKLSIVTKIK
jgi:hypothetical protein